MISDGGGDKGGGGRDSGSSDAFSQEAWQPQDVGSEVARPSDAVSEAVSEANNIASGVTSMTTDKRNRLANDEEATQNFDCVGRETCAVLGEQNARQGVPQVAATMITGALETGIAKSQKK